MVKGKRTLGAWSVGGRRQLQNELGALGKAQIS